MRCFPEGSKCNLYTPLLCAPGCFEFCCRPVFCFGLRKLDRGILIIFSGERRLMWIKRSAVAMKSWSEATVKATSEPGMSTCTRPRTNRGSVVVSIP